MGTTLPEKGPLPGARPESKAETSDKKSVKPPAEETKTPVETSDAISEAPPPEDKAALDACLTDLKSIGAQFDTIDPIRGENGCGIENPVRLTGLAGNISIAPDTEMRCETALQFARWMKESVVPSLAVAIPGERMKSVQQASTYVCRKRNGAETGKISEHAFGNAIDIAGFTLDSGKTVTIEPRERGSTLEDAFQRTITAAACLYFTTVLEPGSDAAHENHLHLDVKGRKGGYRYCW
jgi:hypothetical protein